MINGGIYYISNYTTFTAPPTSSRAAAPLPSVGLSRQLFLSASINTHYSRPLLSQPPLTNRKSPTLSQFVESHVLFTNTHPPSIFNILFSMICSCTPQFSIFVLFHHFDFYMLGLRLLKEKKNEIMFGF